MTICTSSPRGTLIKPNFSDDDPITALFISPSGRFAATITETSLSVICLTSIQHVILDPIDVSEIIDSAGSNYANTEGTYTGVVWSPDESILFVSTADGLIGAVKIEAVEPFSASDFGSADGDDMDSTILNSAPAPFQLILDTVLIFPVKQFLMAPSAGCLIVVSKRTRMLYIVDWKNYKNRAQRFILPPSDSSPHTGSPCINSVLPQFVDIGESELKQEGVSAIQAAISYTGDALLILYDDGVVKSFAVSTPSSDMCTLVPCPPASIIEVEGSKLAVASGSSLLVYSVTSSTMFALLWKVAIPEPLTSLSWSMGYLSLASPSGVSIVNEYGSKSLVSHSTISPWRDVCASIPNRVLLTTSPNSPLVEVVALGVSSGLSSMCTSSSQSQLIIARDSLRLFTFPSRQWRYIPLPWMYVQDNGPLTDAVVQINPSSRFLVAVGSRGFALWSCYTSSLTSASKRAGKWEVLAEKSQEDRIGQIELVGFLSDTVFFTKSENSNEVLLWSVLKRVDLSFILASVRLHSADVDAATCDPVRGVLLIAYKGESRMDVLRLKPDPKKESYTLESVAVLTTDFPAPPRRLFLVAAPRASLSTVVGLTRGSSDLYMWSGERICGNVDSLFSAVELGQPTHSANKYGANGLVTATASLDTSSGLHTPEPVPAYPRTDSIEDMDDEEFEEIHESMANTPGTFYIGDAKCKFCHGLSKKPKLRGRVIAAIHKQHPVVWIVDHTGSVSSWAVMEGTVYSSRLEFISRFSDEAVTSCTSLGEGNQIIGVSGPLGVLASVNGSDMRIAFSSAVHPILVASTNPADSISIFQRVQHSPFFPTIVEVYLHTVLNASLPILSKLAPPFDSKTLLQVNPVLCSHPLAKSVLIRLLHAFWVGSHFPSVFAAAFAAAVRKTEPHIVFPLATCGALTGVPCEDVFNDCVSRGRLREAALLLVIIQERTGPVVVREQFAVPLFRESLLVQDYGLARDIAHFHLSFSTVVRSPIQREFFWAPRVLDGDMTEAVLRVGIDTVVISHLNYLINESMDWLRLIRFVEKLRLVFAEWLLVVPRQEYLDVTLLVPAFRHVHDTLDIGGRPFVFETLTSAFKKANWSTHWKAIAIAFESVEAVRECTSGDTVVTDDQARAVIGQYI